MALNLRCYLTHNSKAQVLSLFFLMQVCICNTHKTLSQLFARLLQYSFLAKSASYPRLCILPSNRKYKCAALFRRPYKSQFSKEVGQPNKNACMLPSTEFSAFSAKSFSAKHIARSANVTTKSNNTHSSTIQTYVSSVKLVSGNLQVSLDY